MRKFHTSLYGYQKKSVHEQLKRLELEHMQSKQLLESELNELSEQIKQLKQEIQIQQEGGREE